MVQENTGNGEGSITMVKISQVIDACQINGDEHQLKLIETEDPDKKIPIESLEPSIRDTIEFTEGKILQGIDAWEDNEDQFFGLTG